MNLNLKRGKSSDLTLVLGNYFQHNADVHSKLFNLLTQGNLTYSYAEKEEDYYSIQLLLNQQKKSDPPKTSAPPENKKPIKEKENLDFSQILAKYSYQPQAKNALSKPKSKVPDNFKLRLYLLYITSSNLLQLKVLFEKFKKINDNDAKYIFILEGIQDYVSSNELKNKGKQKKENFMSQQFFSQGIIIKESDTNQEEVVFENREKFEEFLVNLSIESQMDYKLTTNYDETLEFLKSCIVATIDSKYKKNLGYFDVKGHSHTLVSVYAGFEDFYSLAWIELLMAIPGISEDKAVAIAKQYPTMKSLMDALEKNENKSLLEDIKVVHNYDESKAKRLGKAASAKVIKALTSDNPDEII